MAGKIRELILRWFVLREQGVTLSPEELCREAPQYQAEVAKTLEWAFKSSSSTVTKDHADPSTDIVVTKESPISELLIRWQVARERGIDIQVEELCQDCPELREDVHARLSAMRNLYALLDQQTADPTDIVRNPEGGSCPVIAGYEAIEPLGKGGMGVVYKAKQASLNRLVALKMIRDGAHTRPETLARFRTEAESVARLQHPNIVQVFEVGEHRGRPFLAMEFCPGGSLDSKLAGKPLRPREAAELARTLALAVDAAHRARVVHRDLKPANILIAADGTPKITDFGLARNLDEEGQTQTGSVMGTPSYMAPEQARGDSEITPAADVYALGAMLYEFLTGKPPFRGSTTYDTIRQVLNEDAVSPRQLRATIPRDLESICLTCLEKDISKRYAGAAELAEDLRRFVEREPVAARRIGFLSRGWRWCRRYPTVATLIGLLAVSLVAGTVAATTFAVRAEKAKQDETARAEAESRAKGEAQAARQEAEQHLVDLASTSGVAAARHKDHALAQLWFAKAVQLANADTERQEVNRVRAANWSKLVPSPMRAMRTANFRSLWGRFKVFEMHPGGQHLLILTDTGVCNVWDLASDSLTTLPGGARPRSATAWSPSGDRLALATTEGEVELFSFPELHRLERWEAQGPVRPLAFSLNGRYLAWGEKLGVRVWDCRERVMGTPMLPHPKPVVTITFNAAGTCLATSCEDFKARVFRLGAKGSDSPIFAPVPHDAGEVSIAHGGRDSVAPLFINNGRGLLTITNRNTGIWRDAETGKVLYQLTEPSAGHSIMAVRVCPYDRHLVVLWAGRVVVWDVTTGKKVGEVDHRHELAEDAYFDATGSTLCTCGHDTTVRLWRLVPARPAALEPVCSPVRHPTFVVRVRPSAASPVFASAQADGTVTIWRWPPISIPDTALPQGGTSRVCFSDDGRHFLGPGVSYRNATQQSTRVFDAATGMPAGPPLRAPRYVLDAIFAPDGQRVATASTTDRTPGNSRGVVQLWDWRTGQKLGDPIPLEREPRGLAFSPDSRHLAVVCEDGRLVILRGTDGAVQFNIDTGNHPRLTANHWTANGSARFSPEGLLVTWEMDHVVRVWDPNTGRLLRTLAHDERISDVSFGPNPPCLVTAARDTKVRLWDLSTGKLLLPPLPHPRVVAAARVAPDGEQVLSICEDGAVRAWDRRSGRLVSTWKQDQENSQNFAISGDNRWLVTAGIKDVTVVDRKTGIPVAPPVANGFVNLSVGISEKGQRLVVGGFAQTLEVFDLGAMTSPSRQAPSDLTLQAELGACLWIQPNGGLGQLNSEEWWLRWQKLRESKSPQLVWPGAERSRSTASHNVLLSDGQRLPPTQGLGPCVDSRNVLACRGLGPAGRDCIEVDGKTSQLVYHHTGIPIEECTLSVWVQPMKWEERETRVVCGTWIEPYNAPLVLQMENGRIYGGTLAGQYYSTGGIFLEPEQWAHLCLVKSNGNLTLFVNGQRRGWVAMPERVVSAASLLSLGTNPWGEPKGLRARYAGLELIDRALSRQRTLADWFSSENELGTG